MSGRWRGSWPGRLRVEVELDARVSGLDYYRFVAARQTKVQRDYSGTEFLLKIEDALRRYNTWIVKGIIRGAEIKGKAARVLDFGAGTGTLSVLFETLTGVKPEGVELDPILANIMKERGYVTYSGIEDTAGVFDLIFSSNVLEHIPDDEEVLRQLRRKIAPGGTLAIYVPAFKMLWSSMDDHVGHYRRYNKADLASKLKSSGFIITEMRYCDSAGFLVTMLFKMMQKGRDEPSAEALRFFDRYVLPISKLVDVFTHSFLGKNLLAFARID